MKKHYLKFENHNGYDDFYYPLPDSGSTWSEVLDLIESALDNQYLENGEKLAGISLNIEIVDSIPDDVEFSTNSGNNETN